MTRYAPRCLSLLAGICAAVPLPASSLERLPLPAGCKPAQRSAQARPMEAMDVPVFPPVQLDVRTPFEPSAFSAGGYRYLVYELQLQNYSEASLRVEAVDVLTPAPQDGAELLLRISGQALHDQMRLVGSGAVDSAQMLETGRAGTVFLCVAFDGSFPVPDRLLHRVVLDSAVAQGPEVGTQHDTVKVLSSPVRGSHWLADNGLALDLHHRPGVFVAGGTAQISRRYAIDWKRRVDGKLLAGDPWMYAATMRTGNRYLPLLMPPSSRPGTGSRTTSRGHRPGSLLPCHSAWNRWRATPWFWTWAMASSRTMPIFNVEASRSRPGNGSSVASCWRTSEIQAMPDGHICTSR